jgi:hypothetical protein
MLALLSESALRSLVLAAVVWLGLRALRAHNPHIRMTVWTVVLNASLVMPLLMQLAGPWTTVTVPREVPALPPPLAAWVPSTPAPKPPPSAIELRDIQDYAPRAEAKTSAGAAPAVPPVRRVDWLGVATGLYFVIAGFLMIRLIVGTVLAWRLWRSAQPLHEDWIEGARVRVSSALGMPVTIGRTILLPPDCRNWSATKRSAVLAHEGSHAHYGDFQVLLLARLNCATFWFNPLSWWLARELAALAEAVGDEAAIAATGDAPTYAGILLDIAASARPASLGVAMARPHTVGLRVERILATAQFAARMTLRRGLWIACGLVPLTAICAVAIAQGAPTGADGDTAASAAASATPGSSGRIDLDALSGSRLPYYVVATVPFVETDSRCPEIGETVRISEGVLRLISVSTDARSRSASWSETIGPESYPDDQTYRFRPTAPNCRMDIDIRQQVSRENVWVSLHNMREESLELARRVKEQMRELIEKRGNPREPTPREQANRKLGRAFKRSMRHGAPEARWAKPVPAFVPSASGTCPRRALRHWAIFKSTKRALCSPSSHRSQVI